jgi:short-subunit dehydrogenase
MVTYHNALVTGASSGIGRALALWLARHGVRVHAAARRAPLLEALRDEARTAGATVEPFALDVTRTEEAIGRIQALDQACGGLDLVVANAGVGAFTSGRNLQWEQVERVLAVNVMGAAATISAVAARMAERRRGHLVAISSVAAFRGLPRLAAYAGSKAFLRVFMESLRVDLRGTGVRVSSIHPGFVRSEMTQGNHAPMPFLLETDDAAARIGRAIFRGARQQLFPWPTAAVTRAGMLLPNALYDRLVGRRRVRK